MRITTQMLAHSAAKSGIPFQQTTLLDILNKKSSFSGLLNGVNASADATAIAKKKNYSKLEDISGNLNGYASSLVATDKNSIYDRAKESGSTKDIVSSAKKMVESYNATLKQLRETGDTLNEFYRQQLKLSEIWRLFLHFQHQSLLLFSELFRLLLLPSHAFFPLPREHQSPTQSVS